MSIYFLGIYFGVQDLVRVGLRESLLTLRWGDIGILACSVWWFVQLSKSWHVVDQEVVLGSIASVGIYLMVRMEGNEVGKCVLFGLPFLMLWQFWQYPSETGSFFNSGIWGCFLACVGVIAVGGALCGKTIWVKLYGLVVCIFCVCLLYFASSRAAWLGIISGLLVVGWGILKYVPLWKKLSVAVVLLVLLVTALFSTKGKIESAQGRLLIWKVGWEMGKESVNGLGVGEFARNYMLCQKIYLKEQATPKEKLLADENSYAFNELLRVKVEQGWIGLFLSFVVLASFLFVSYPKEERLLSVCVCGSLVAWCVFACFSYPAANFQTRALFFFLLGIAGNFSPVVCKIRRYSVVLLSITMVTISVLLALPYHRAETHWERCVENGKVENMECLSPLLNSSFILSNTALFLNEAGYFSQAEKVARKGFIQCHSYFSALELGKSLKQQCKYTEAAEIWEEAANILPNRFTPLFWEMEMWYEKGDIKQAKEIAGRILSKPVKIPSSQLTYMRLKAQYILSEN